MADSYRPLVTVLIRRDHSPHFSQLAMETHRQERSLRTPPAETPRQLEGKRLRGSPSGATPKQVSKRAAPSNSPQLSDAGEVVAPSASIRKQLFEAPVLAQKARRPPRNVKWSDDELRLLVEFSALFRDTTEAKSRREWPVARDDMYWSKAAQYVNQNCQTNHNRSGEAQYSTITIHIVHVLYCYIQACFSTSLVYCQGSQCRLKVRLLATEFQTIDDAEVYYNVDYELHTTGHSKNQLQQNLHHID